MHRRFLCPVSVFVFAFASAALWPPPIAQSRLNLPATPYKYAAVPLPAHLALPGNGFDNTPVDNPITDAGATLGRVLFYDTRLSANHSTSCGSCHIQANGFADPKPFSTGFHGGQTDRRSMPLVNLRYYQRARFFWDERAGNLEQMVLLPIQNRVEMGQTLPAVVAQLSDDAIYPRLFERAFGTREITEPRIGRALAQFVRSMVSYRSRYDEGRARVTSANDDFANFTLQENRGKALFMRNCASCHMKDGNEHFFVPTPANTGLRRDAPAEDGGVGDVTLRIADFGSFKSPSLRNVEVTAPYGHDGRFATLEALVDHYSDNAISDPSLGYVMPVGPLEFTVSERAALVSFLKTLTDRKFLADPKFSSPFTPAPPIVRPVRTLERSNPSNPSNDPVVNVRRPAFAPPASVVQRIMSFDADADSRVSKDELPERMQALMARVDKNQDGFLTTDEVRNAVDANFRVEGRTSITRGKSDGVPGVIGDLKLPAPKHQQAMAIVKRYTVAGDGSDPLSAALSMELRQLLDAEEFENFTAAARRLRFDRTVVGGVVGGHVRPAVIVPSGRPSRS